MYISLIFGAKALRLTMGVQRLYLRTCISVVFVTIDVIFLQFPSAVCLIGDVNIPLPEISLAGILEREANGSLYPLCVFFTTGQKDSKVAEKYFIRSMQYFDDEAHWQFRKFTVKNNGSASKHVPPKIPAIQCFSVWLEEDIYTGPWKLRPVKDWVQALLKNCNSRIPFMSEDGDLLQDVNKSLVLMIFIEGPAFQDAQRNHLKGMRDDFDSVRFLIHSYHSGQRSTSLLADKFLVETSPAAVLLNFTDNEKVLGKVEGAFKFLEKIEEMLTIQITETLTAISQDSFHDWLQDEHTTSTYLICFHAFWAEENLRYLHSFSRASQVFHNFQATLKFGTVDVEKEREIVTKHINPKLIRKFPFSVLFWKNMTSEGADLHHVLLTSRPTPSAISDFIVKYGLEMNDRHGNMVQYIPWETEDVCQTFLDFSLNDPLCIGRVNSSIKAAMDLESSRERLSDSIQLGVPGERDTTSNTALYNNDVFIDGKKSVLKEKFINTVNQLSDDKWAQVIQQSKYYSSGRMIQDTLVTVPWEVASPQTILVVFIQGGCRSCENNMKLFEKLAKNIEYLGTGIFYIHNCTSDPLTCERQKVRGFPTVMAFRNFGKIRYERCSWNSLMQQYLRMDYHGILTEKLLMEWFAQVSTPTVQYTSQEEFHVLKKINDVSLSATLYPLSLAKKYLPNIAGPNSWYPYECFQLACERLYGQANCYGIITENLQNRDFMMLKENPAMVVTQIEMHRRDNVSALVFSLGKALIATLQNKEDTRLHQFHAPHRYAIKSGQRCEDNHPSCTDVIVSFVQDHSRLPVTHITAAAFHTHGSLGFGEDHSTSIFRAGLPVLLALATSQQLTDDASFLKLLNEAAYQFYNQIVFATLNVDEFPQWAARFVPVHYYRHVVENDKYMTDDMVPSLFIYPRLLIVTAANHQKAIFLPKYEQFSLSSKGEGRTFTKSEIVDFVSEFLSASDDGWIETELF